MGKPEKLTVAEALAQAQLIDGTLAAWDETAPEFVASLGGRDALARECEMTCIGPVPRLDVESWRRASAEYLERWNTAHPPRPAPVVEANPAPLSPPEGAPQEAPPRRRRSAWRIFGR